MKKSKWISIIATILLTLCMAAQPVAAATNKQSSAVSVLAAGTVITSQPETVTAGLNAIVSYSVTATNVASYQWQYSKNETKWYSCTAASATTDTYTFKVKSTTAVNFYRCKIKGTDGKTIYTETVHIDLIPGIVINTQPSSVTAKIGQTVTYTVEADNVATYRWLYSKNATNWYPSGATGCSTNTLSIKLTSTNQNYIFRCEMTGIDGNIKKSARVGAVIITEQPKTCTVAVGKTASYHVAAANIATYLWQYSKDGGVKWYSSSATGFDTDTISFKATSTNRTTIYRCKLTTTNGISVYSTPAGFAEGLKIVKQPVDAEGSIGDMISFSVEAENVSTYQWQYSKDGTTWAKSGASGNTTASIQFAIKDSLKTYVYRCKLTGSDGSVQYTNPAGIVIVTPQIPLAITSQSDSENKIITGDEITFFVTANIDANYTWMYSADGSSYQDLSSAGNTANYTTGTEGYYKVLATDKTNEMNYASSNAFHLTVVDPSVITITGDLPKSISVNPNEAYTLQVDAEISGGLGTEAINYQWQVKTADGEWTDIPQEVNSAYTVNVTDDTVNNFYRCVITSTDSRVEQLISETCTLFKSSLWETEII